MTKTSTGAQGRESPLSSAKQACAPSSSLLPNIFESIGSALNHGIMVMGPDGAFICCNDATSTLLGLPKDLLAPGRQGKHAFKYMYERGDIGANGQPRDLQSHLSELYEAQNAGVLSKKTWHQVRPDGRNIVVDRIAMADGHAIFLIAERTASARRDQMLKIALKSANAGYWSFSFRDKKFKFSDHIRAQFSDAELTKIEDTGLWAIIHPDDINHVRKAWSQGFKTAETFEFTHRVKLDKGGVKYFQNIGKPEFADNGKPIGITCFIADVTQQNLDAELLTKAKDTAETTLRANNDFLARMSHEIRTPMNGIMGMADALAHSGRCDGVIEQLDVIKSSALNMLRVLDDTLEHAKLNAKKVAIKSTQASPRKLLTDICALWERKAQDNGTKLTLHIDDAVPETFMFDSFRLQQCINNLMSNAVKFTENGHIRLIAAIVEKDGHPPSFVTAVKDNGIGMTPEQQARVFTPYTQADDTITQRFGGTGLGMSITKGLVDLMQGTISLKSEAESGTTFIISLPCRDMKLQSPKAELESIIDALPKAAPNNAEDVKQLTEKLRPVHRPQMATTVLFKNEFPEDEFKNLRLLIAEDNATNQIVVKSLLEPVVGDIYFAENGAQAIEILDTKPVDLVLMDIHMPVMDGIEATIAIRSANKPWSNIGIIALTADPEYQQKRICRNIGMNDAIAKPVSRNEVLQSFRAVLEETQYGAEPMTDAHQASA